MMLPTHAIVGLAIAAPVAIFVPDLAPVALASGFLGGILPDLDLYAGHRRTLHYPTGYAIAAVVAIGLAALWTTPATIAAAVFFLGATAHCRMDRYGGGLELRPWEGTSDRAVYDHVQGRWLPPKRWVRYDGAPEDVALTGLLGVPLYFVVDAPFQWLIVGALSIAITYALLRRHLADLAPIVFSRVPGPIAVYVPDRYRE